MTLVVPDVGEQMLLDNALKTASPGAQSLKLYSNNYDPVKGSTAGNFTECATGGYAAKTLARAGWNAAVAGSPSYSQCTTASTWSFTGAVTVVGYYVIDAGGTLMWAERLYATTGQAFANGDTLSVTPKITLGSVSGD